MKKNLEGLFATNPEAKDKLAIIDWMALLLLRWHDKYQHTIKSTEELLKVMLKLGSKQKLKWRYHIN